jgi:predicted nucleic acid-binding protein
MTLAVIDASVAAKWFLPADGETLIDEAFYLLRRYTKGELQLLVPDLFWAELANIFWKAIRQRRWEKSAAQTALASLEERRLPSVSSLSVLEVAFGIATAFDRTIYDALYVALAMRSKAQFITADERLANALAAQLPVKWLGSL